MSLSSLTAYVSYLTGVLVPGRQHTESGADFLHVWLKVIIFLLQLKHNYCTLAAMSLSTSYTVKLENFTCH